MATIKLNEARSQRTYVYSGRLMNRPNGDACGVATCAWPLHERRQTAKLTGRGAASPTGS